MSTIETTTVTEILSKGGSLQLVLSAVRPLEKISGKKVERLPKKVELSDKVKTAVEQFPAMIERAVTPEVRRRLTVAEVAALLDERENLDLIESVIKARKDAQKVAAFNHHDVVLEETLTPEELAELDRDKDGHYVAAGGAFAPDHEKGFVRQLANGSPSLSVDALEAQIDAHGDSFTRKDYLACTTERRVLDEAKVLLHLRKRPEIIEAIRAATTPGNITTKHALGKEKE